MRARTWILAAVVTSAAVALPTTASAAATHDCAALKVPGTGFHATHITARGVTCTYVRHVFIPDVVKNVFPKGWAFHVTHPSSTTAKDVVTNGAKQITFLLSLTS